MSPTSSWGFLVWNREAELWGDMRGAPDLLSDADLQRGDGVGVEQQHEAGQEGPQDQPLAHGPPGLPMPQHPGHLLPERRDIDAKDTDTRGCVAHTRHEAREHFMGMATPRQASHWHLACPSHGDSRSMAQVQQLCPPSQPLPAWENRETPRVGKDAGLGLGERGAGPWTAQGQSGQLRDKVATLQWDTTSLSRSSLRALGSMQAGAGAAAARDGLGAAIPSQWASPGLGGPLLPWQFGLAQVGARDTGLGTEECRKDGTPKHKEHMHTHTEHTQTPLYTLVCSWTHVYQCMIIYTHRSMHDYIHTCTHKMCTHKM